MTVTYFLSGIRMPNECSVRPFLTFIPVPIPAVYFWGNFLAQGVLFH